MENLINQMRVRYSGIDKENKGDPRRLKDRRIPPQKTSSFKEGKKVQNWFRRQFSREMSRGYDDMEGDEFRTAVAAAAFAVSEIVDEPRKPRERREESLGKKKSKARDDTIPVSRTRERGESSLSKAKNKEEDDAVPISKPRSPLRKRSSEFPERRVSFGADMDAKVPDKVNFPESTIADTELKDEVPRKPAVSVPSIKKPPTSPDKQLDRTTSKKPERDMPKGSQASTEQQKFPPAEVKRQDPKSRYGDSKAEVWEKTEMERAKERYEKLNAKILEWEKEKKVKAKKKLTRKESEMERKRARALKDYKSTMEMIDQIASGARAQAEENLRREEIKIKEKANKIRSTGKIPTNKCFCC